MFHTVLLTLFLFKLMVKNAFPPQGPQKIPRFSIVENIEHFSLEKIEVVLPDKLEVVWGLMSRKFRLQNFTPLLMHRQLPMQQLPRQTNAQATTAQVDNCPGKTTAKVGQLPR